MLIIHFLFLKYVGFPVFGKIEEMNIKRKKEKKKTIKVIACQMMFILYILLNKEVITAYLT